MVRAARSQGFVQRQLDRLDEPHIAPITDLVRELRAERPDQWMPYVAPYHGGTSAEVLVLFQDPGHKTADSQMIGVENDDPSAATLCECLHEAGVGLDKVAPWNAYPWYRPDQSRGLRASEMDEGIKPLVRLLSLLPEVHTVVLGGGDAMKAWARFSRQRPTAASRYRVLETRHTSGRGITNGGRHTKAEGMAHVVGTLREAIVPPTS